MSDPPRRGWRETMEPGLYRAHRLACPSSADHRPGRRCSCPWQVAAPGARPGTTRIVTTPGTIGEARAARRRLLAEGRPAEVEAPPAIAPGTLDDFAAHYLRAMEPRQAPATIKTTENAYRLRISPDLGGLPLLALTRERVEVWLADLLAAQASWDQVHKAVKALRVILATAVEWERIAINPAARLKLPKLPPDAPRAVERVLTLDELGRVFAATAANVRVETMFRTAGEAGLRKGEVIGLRWPDLDLSGRRLTVERSVWQENGRGGAPPRRIVKEPKGGRHRRIAISGVLAARFGDWYAQSVVEGGADAAGYVWPGREGGPMGEGTPGQALGRVLIRAGLVDSAGRPRGHLPRPAAHGRLDHAGAGRRADRGLEAAGPREPEHHGDALRAPARGHPA